MRRLSEIVNLQWRPVFAETIGKNAVAILGGSSVEGPAADCLNRPDGLYFGGLPRVILYIHFDISGGRRLVETDRIAKVWLRGESGASHNDLMTSPEGIFESGLPYPVLRIIAGADPLAVELHADPAMDDSMMQTFVYYFVGTILLVNNYRLLLTVECDVRSTGKLCERKDSAEGCDPMGGED
jgi:hypothetical protein